MQPLNTVWDPGLYPDAENIYQWGKPEKLK